MQTFYLDPHNAQKKKRKKKKIGQLRIGLSHFLQKPIRHLILNAIITLGFLIGVVVFGMWAFGMAEFYYAFHTYGRDTTAAVINCEMVSGRSGPYPLVTYRYTVNDKTYSDTWLPLQLDYPDCSLASYAVINIVYLENDPADSIVGNTAEHAPSISIVLLLAVGAVVHGISALIYGKRVLLDFVLPLWRWWNQAARIVALPGEIVAVKGKYSPLIEITYHYSSPEDQVLLGKAILPRSKHGKDNPPQVGMGVVVLYYSPDIVALA